MSDAGAQRLRPVLSQTDVIFIVFAATIGGGLFTLLSPAIALAGAAVLIVIAADAALEFLTAVRYAQLSSALPDVGGGQQWIRQGLGNFGGHICGWISWLAHSVACGVYAISLGFYLNYTFLNYLPQAAVGEKVFAISIIIVLSIVNYLGVKFTGRINKYGAIGAIGILALFVALGLLTSASDIEASAKNFDNFFMYGFSGVFSGMGMFYLAFQGSEVGAQAGEEVRNPKDLKRGIIIGLLVITSIYLLVTFVAIAGVHASDLSSASYLADAKEGALIAASSKFKLGTILFPAILVAGIIVAFIALNATIYSSSHAFLALARHKSIPRLLDRIDPKFGTPTFGIVISGFLILLMAAVMPLKDIAVVADVLFMFLFGLLHLAYADLRRRKKALQTNKVYTLPFYPYLEIFPIPGYPYSIVFVYGALIAFMWHVSPLGVLFGVGWLFLGVILYSRYAMIKEIEEIDSSTIYGVEARRDTRSRFKVHCVLPDSSAITEHRKVFMLKFVSAIASIRKQGAKFFCYADSGANKNQGEYDDRLSRYFQAYFAPLEIFFREREDLSFAGAGRLVQDKGEDIVAMVERYDPDILIIPYEQLRELRRRVLSIRQFHHVLQEVRCDLIISKINDGARNPVRVLVPFRVKSHNQNNRLLAETVTAFSKFFDGKPTFLVIDDDKKGSARQKIEKDLRDIGIPEDLAGDIRIIHAGVVADRILEMSKDFDVVIMGSSRGGSFSEITLGQTAELVLERCETTTIVVRHHQEVFDPITNPIRALYEEIYKFFAKKVPGN